MSAPITADDVKKIFEEVSGRLISDNEARTKAAVDAMKAEIVKDLGDKNKERLIDQIREGADGEIKVSKKATDGLDFARFVRAMAGAKHIGNGMTPLALAKTWVKDDRGMESVVKVLEAQSAANGGFLVPEAVSDEIIDLLRAAVVVQASGAAMVPMPNGNLSMRYQATSSTASYGSERGLIALSNPTLGRMTLSAKKLAARVIVSNDLLKFSNQRANAFVRDDLVRTLAVRADLGLIRDDGSLSTPTGLRWLTPASNVVDRTLDTGAITLETVTNDLADASYRLEAANIPMRRPGWLMNPRTKSFLFKLRDGNGNQVFRPELASGMLFGMPFRLTTNIPVTLGTAGDESEIYLVDFDSVVIGEVGGIELASSDLGDGFSTDDTHIRAIMQHDIGVRYRGAESTVITAVDWI